MPETIKYRNQTFWQFINVCCKHKNRFIESVYYLFYFRFNYRKDIYPCCLYNV